MVQTWYSPQEIAEALHVHHQTVRDWIHEGKLEAVKFGKLWRVPESALDAFTGKKAKPEKKQQRRDAAIRAELERML